MKNKKILGSLIIIMIIATYFPVSSSLMAADTRIPYVHISAPTPATVEAGGCVSYTITADRATTLNVKTSDIGIAGAGVTLEKSVSGSGGMITVTLSNIQGPVDKLVSIALKAGVAKNEYGESLMTAKSAAFKIIAAPTPVPTPTPTPTPAPTPKPAPTPSTPVVKKPSVVNSNSYTNTTSISNVVDNAVQNPTPVTSTTVENIDETDTTKPIITIEAPTPNSIKVGETVEYVVNYSDNKAIQNISLSKDNIKLYGFTAEVNIIDSGANKKIVRLVNVKGALGTQKYISINSGTVTDVGGNKDDGIAKSEMFKIINDKMAENLPEDWIENPNTGK